MPVVASIFSGRSTYINFAYCLQLKMPIKQRPVSPHIQIYRPQLPSMLSILHRATGLFLVLGLIVICSWLVCVALGEESFQMFNSIGSTLAGKILSLGLVFSLVYHCFNGIRHLVWDYGYGFELTSVYLSGGIVFLLSIVVTLLIVVRAWLY